MNAFLSMVAYLDLIRMARMKYYLSDVVLDFECEQWCVYNYIIIYTPFPYPKLCPYPKPTQQQTLVGTPKDPTNQIAARNLRAPIKP